MSQSNIRIMLICFFDIKGVIDSETVPGGATLNQTFYMTPWGANKGTVERTLTDSSPREGACAFFASSVAIFNKNYELERTRNIVIMDHFKVPSQHPVRGIEENHSNRTLAEILFPDFSKIKWEGQLLWSQTVKLQPKNCFLSCFYVCFISENSKKFRGSVFLQ